MTLSLSEACMSRFSVRAIDEAGNEELLDSGSNMIEMIVPPCVVLPLVTKDDQQN